MPSSVWLVWKLHSGLPVDGIGGHQGAAFLAEDHEAGGRRQRAAPRLRRARLRQFPRDRAGADVDGRRMRCGFGIGAVRCEPPRYVLPALPVALLALRVDAALLERLHVIEAGRRD